VATQARAGEALQHKMQQLQDGTAQHDALASQAWPSVIYDSIYNLLCLPPSL
jgi:hypothetical protein